MSEDHLLSGKAINQKVGPLPVWGWGIVGAVGVVGGIYLSKRIGKAAPKAAAPAAKPPVVTDPKGDTTTATLAPVNLPLPNLGNDFLVPGLPRLPKAPPAPRPPSQWHPPAPPPPPVVTQVATPPPARTVTVVHGDTLSGIARREYGSAGRWPSIFNANADVIDQTARAHGKTSSDHGHWIYPGTVLRIP